MLMAMGRDGLLPSFFSDVSEKTQVPVKSTIITVICAASLAIFSQPRILMAMARDGLLSSFFSDVSEKTQVAEFLSRHVLPQLQMEAAWVLTNITASDYAMLVAECGVVPRLLELLGSPNANVRHQAMWALGNIAADMPSCRENQPMRRYWQMHVGPFIIYAMVWKVASKLVLDTDSCTLNL